MTQEELALIKSCLINADNLFALYATNLQQWQRQNKRALKIITQEQLRQNHNARVAAATSPLQDRS